MTQIDNGRSVNLTIHRLYDGLAMEVGGRVVFRPQAGADPRAARGGIMDGVPLRVVDVREEAGGNGLWSVALVAFEHRAQN